jgi:hypothetical protein
MPGAAKRGIKSVITSDGVILIAFLHTIYLLSCRPFIQSSSQSIKFSRKQGSISIMGQGRVLVIAGSDSSGGA